MQHCDDPESDDQDGDDRARDGWADREPTVRLFAGVWPPPHVHGVLATLERPAVPAVRWTTPDQWHVTVAFLGDVAESLVGEVGTALMTGVARAAAPLEARLGPATQRLGQAVLCVPVDGLDDLAGAVRVALGDVLSDLELDRTPYRGHLTLARSRGRRAIPASLAGVPIVARWRVPQVDLVRSVLEPGGARYTTIMSATVPP